MHEDQAAAPARRGDWGRRKAFTGLGEVTMRPLSDPGVAGRVAPFAGAAVIAVVLVLLPPTSSDGSMLAVAAALTAVVIAAALLVPWVRLPPWCQAAVPLAFFAVVALLRQAGGGATSGYSPLVMLPIIWLAIYGSRTQFRLVIVATAVAFLTPQILVGPPLYPDTGWRGSIIWVTVGLLGGSAIQKLVDQSRHHTADVAALGAITRALTAGSDPRRELCDAAQVVTDAAFVVLFEPQVDGVLVATAGTEGVTLGLHIDPETHSCATAEAWRTGTRIYLADAAVDPHSSKLAVHANARALLCQPVTRRERTTAVLVVGFSQSHQHVPASALYLVEMLAAEMQAAQNARSLTAAEDLVRTVMASASIGIALADLDGSFRVVNRALRDLVGYDEAWFLAHRVRDMVHPDDVEEVLRARARVIAGSSGKSVMMLRLVRADGATVWVRRVSVLLHDTDGEPNLLMVQLEDITAEHEAQEALTYQAFHDPLTGLHNRAWILDILKVDLRAAERLGHSVGALFVDLDNFQVVNDSLGHEAGDEVLATVADRIVGALRPGDRVGRFGGDEFVIVVQRVQDILEVERCAERVSASIAGDLQVRGHRIVPTASIGIATSTSSSTPESLLGDADSALSRAKAAGRASWHFFDEAMHAQAVARLTLEDQLRDAITRSEFVVYYQPIVALADAHVVGHEALVRWAHPTRGLLIPGEFLDVAEDTGLITAIGAQVLDQACAMLAERPDLPGPISVNVSAVQLAAPGWLDSVRDSLAAHRVDPARIVIEVTETAVLNLADSARVALETLRGLGVGIHLDDFGTGYSSISVLRDLPVTGVKLDLRFVQDLTDGESQANALAQGVSGLVNGMHLTGIAEGIETQMQADILRAQGWECGQGFYFGRPAALPVAH